MFQLDGAVSEVGAASHHSTPANTTNTFDPLFEDSVNEDANFPAKPNYRVLEATTSMVAPNTPRCWRFYVDHTMYRIVVITLC